MEIPKLLQFLFSRKTPVREPTAPPRRQWITNPWHAVSVSPGPQPCEAVRHATGRRYLSNEAPTLPVDGCTARNCLCGYRHHPDRRRSPRRKSDLLTTRPSFAGVERRRSAGRRSTD